MIKCIFENGRKANLRHVTVGAIVVNKKIEILLVKRASHLINGGKFGIPGGFLDRGETTEQGTIRELKEETGLNGKIIALFQIVDIPNRPKEDRQNVHLNYIVEVEKEGPFNKNDEVEETKWFSFDEIPSEADFAFDHRRFVELYFEYLDKPFSLPKLNY